MDCLWFGWDRVGFPSSTLALTAIFIVQVLLRQPYCSDVLGARLPWHDKMALSSSRLPGPLALTIFLPPFASPSVLHVRVAL